jgi:hypothetical protein
MTRGCFGVARVAAGHLTTVNLALAVVPAPPPGGLYEAGLVEPGDAARP